jgi:hypothetical protein
MPSHRDTRLDAFFSDEWTPFVPPVGPVNPRGVHFNRFTSPLNQPLTAVRSMKNPLDPSVAIAEPRPQPESHMLPQVRGRDHEYFIFVPPSVLAFGLVPGAHVKVSVLFGAFDEYNRHGLRTFFEGSADRVLVVLPGIEPTANNAGQAWGIGITTDMVRQLLAASVLPIVPTFTIDTLAGYSTGYRGVNGTVNNAFIPLADIKRLIFYDALFWGDQPALPAGEAPLPNPSGVSPPAVGSPRNTWRMLKAVKAANPSVEIVTYEVVEPGGTPRDAGKLRADVPAAGLINLKPLESALTALVLARVLGNGVQDGYFQLGGVPPPVATLIGTLPARGTLASGPGTAARATNGTLAAWALANAVAVNNAAASASLGLSLIQTHKLMGWGVPTSGDMRHDGFMQEFAWEFLA